MKELMAVLFGLVCGSAHAAWHFDTLSEPPAKQMTVEIGYQQAHKNITQALNKCTKGFDVVNGIIYSDLGESEIVFHNKGKLAVAQAVYRLTRIENGHSKIEAWTTPTVFGGGPKHFSDGLEMLVNQGENIDCHLAGF